MGRVVQDIVPKRNNCAVSVEYQRSTNKIQCDTSANCTCRTPQPHACSTDALLPYYWCRTGAVPTQHQPCNTAVPRQYHCNTDTVPASSAPLHKQCGTAVNHRMSSEVPLQYHHSTRAVPQQYRGITNLAVVLYQYSTHSGIVNSWHWFKCDIGLAMALPCFCTDSAMGPCRCLLRRCHAGTAVGLHWHCNGTAAALQWSCNGSAIVPHWTCTGAARQCWGCNGTASALRFD